MAVKIQFAQGLNVGNVGEALVGTTGAAVVASDGNASPGSVTHYRWTWIDVPTLSTFPLGFITEGPVDNISFVPDVQGDYHLMVEAFGPTGFKTVDRRVFRVNLGSGRSLPAFDAEADALNFLGQSRGWKPDMEKWLLYIESLVSPGLSSSGAQGQIQSAGAVPGTFQAIAGLYALSGPAIAFGAPGSIPGFGYVRFPFNAAARDLVTSRYDASNEAPILIQEGAALQWGHEGFWTMAFKGVGLDFWSRANAGILRGGTSGSGTVSALWNANGLQVGSSIDLANGQVVLGLRAAAVVPSTNPSSGVVIYVDSADDYAAKYRRPNGSVIPLDVLVDPSTTDFRLTAQTLTPIPNADIPTVNTLYLTPYCGNTIALYNGSRWVMRTSNEVSLALSGLTSGKNYDVFAYWNGSAVVLELSAAWNTDSNRSQGIVRVGGAWVKATDNTRRLVGTIRATGASSTADTKAQRFVWNSDNQRRRALFRQETAISWTVPTSASFRVANNNAANCVEWVQGIADVVTIDIQVPYGSTNPGFGVQTAIGIDSTSAFTLPQLNGTLANRDDVAGAGYGYVNAKYAGISADGYHKANWLERHGGITTCTMYGRIQNGGTGLDWGASGMIGYLDA